MTALAKSTRPQSLARINPEISQQIAQITHECSHTEIEKLPAFDQAFTLADGFARLRELITGDVMKSIISLKNSKLGFKTDERSGSPYPIDTVRDCLIEAALMGLRPVGNEFNILAGNSYATREGLSRLVKEFPGLSDLRKAFQVVRFTKAGTQDVAIVACKATWKIDGKDQTLPIDPYEIPVRMNAGMGLDAVIGKADRKLLMVIYRQLTGSETISDGDASEASPPPATGAANRVQTVKNQIAEQKAAIVADSPATEPSDAAPAADAGMEVKVIDGLVAANDAMGQPNSPPAQSADPVETKKPGRPKSIGIDARTQWLDKVNKFRLTNREKFYAVMAEQFPDVPVSAIPDDQLESIADACGVK